MSAFYGICGGGGRVLTAVALQTLRAVVIATLFRSIAVEACDDDDVDQDDCEAQSAADAGRERENELAAWVLCTSINIFALMVATRRWDLTRCGLCWEKHINCSNPCLEQQPQSHLQTEPKMWCSGGTNTRITQAHAGCAIGVYGISTICFGGLIGWSIGESLGYFWFTVYTAMLAACDPHDCRGTGLSDRTATKHRGEVTRLGWERGWGWKIER